MPFVYFHVLAFVVWMVMVEESPWPSLTLVVSLEAIFFSTFVMIGQSQPATRSADRDSPVRGSTGSVRSGLDDERPGTRLSTLPEVLEPAAPRA